MEKIKINRGVFNFLSKQGCSIHDMRRLLSLYALEVHSIKRPKRVSGEWYLIISELAQQDFASFKRIYNKNKIIRKPVMSYNNWYDECSMDGSFAYNGVADDF